jgi:hypothetical protein
LQHRKYGGTDCVKNRCPAEWLWYKAGRGAAIDEGAAHVGGFLLQDGRRKRWREEAKTKVWGR